MNLKTIYKYEPKLYIMQQYQWPSERESPWSRVCPSCCSQRWKRGSHSWLRCYCYGREPDGLNTLAIPTRTFISLPVVRGGTRRRAREPIETDTTAKKRQALTDPSTSTPNDEIVQVEDLDVNASSEIREEQAKIAATRPLVNKVVLHGSRSLTTIISVRRYRK